jgi:hypothetical protein
VSSIQQALSKLSRAIGHLESSVHHVEQSMKGQQRDMFAAAPVHPSAVANNNSVDTELVASRLDGAIAQIEKVLKEGRGKEGRR